MSQDVLDVAEEEEHSESEEVSQSLNPDPVARPMSAVSVPVLRVRGVH